MVRKVTTLVAARLNVASPDVDVLAQKANSDKRQPFRLSRRSLVSGVISAIVHGATLVALGLIVLPHRLPGSIARLDINTVTPEKLSVERLSDVQPIDLHPARVVDVDSFEPPQFSIHNELPRTTSAAPLPMTVSAATLDVRIAPQLLTEFDGAKLQSTLGRIRSPSQRLLAVYYRGGSSAGERAVDRALAWLSRHQQADGGWNFDHRGGGDCNGRCRSPGTLAPARAAATAMALLPFLAAGQTHKQGEYKKQIESGLKFLVRSLQTTEFGGSFTHSGGSMYAQALATIALCEALAMTRDRDLIAPAQSATAFIINTQDPQGGGWRYFPGMPGDTSVTGWQLMALKSADNAYISVPVVTIERMRTFFDYVQHDDGAAYGYTQPDKDSTSSTPVGLLCRMILGWKREEPALVRGVDSLSIGGPTTDNVYYNFYATQVLHHFGGPLWDKWNFKMREGLIASQAKEGHEAGSWMAVETNLADRHASLSGGRLYTTALAALTLEVYYRHLPLYGKQISFED